MKEEGNIDTTGLEHVSIHVEDTGAKGKGGVKDRALHGKGLSPILSVTTHPDSPQQEHAPEIKHVENLVIDTASLPTVATSTSISVPSEPSGRLKLLPRRPPPAREAATNDDVMMTDVAAEKKTRLPNGTENRAAVKQKKKQKKPKTAVEEREKRPAAAKKQKKPLANAAPSEERIEECLKRVTLAGLDVEGYSLKQARTTAEQELALDAGFFKHDRAWKARSIEIVDQAVAEHAMPSARTKPTQKSNHSQSTISEANVNIMRRGPDTAIAQATNAFRMIQKPRQERHATPATPPALLASRCSHSHAHPAHLANFLTPRSQNATPSQDATPAVEYRPRSESPDGLV